MLNLDLEDFFPSINFGRVRGLFIAPPYNLPEKVATVLAQICCYKNSLPQGALTSPIVSNMICAKMDTQLQRLAKDHKCIYTRYADDITFSTSLSNFPRTLAVMKSQFTGEQLIIGDRLEEIITSNGFAINLSKLRLHRRNQRQEVTGLTINEFPNVRRSYVKQIRAMLYAWEKFGLENAQEEFRTNRYKKYRSPYKQENHVLSFKAVVRGKIDFLGSVKGKTNFAYQRFLYHYERLDKGENSNLPHVFISYSSKDRIFAVDLERSLADKGVNAWLDVKNIRSGKKWSDEIQFGLDACRVMILILTPSSMNSKNVADEWDYYLEKGKPILPILLMPCEIHFRLNRIQHIDFSQTEYKAACQRLFHELKIKGVIS